jgi:hypothetical protein
MADLQRLAPEDIERITGIERDHPVAQRNQLRRWGIKAEVNARREVVCFSSWVALAGLPPAEQARYLQDLSANDEADDDIGLNLGALDGASAKAGR